MKKLILFGALAAAFVAFVGTDVVSATVARARHAIRDGLTKDVPLETQLAEARNQVDAYAESIIRGEVAAENLTAMVQRVEREVRSLEARIGRDRAALVQARQDLEVVPTSTNRRGDAERDAVRLARAFEARSELLERRRQDLERLRGEHAATLTALEQARSEQTRLSEEVRVLAAEIESLEARTAAARTREAVGDATVASSGHAAAIERLDAIRARVRERNKLLQYYEVERVTLVSEDAAPWVDREPVDAMTAVEAALAAWPE
jgi:hypothetical protein